MGGRKHTTTRKLEVIVTTLYTLRKMPRPFSDSAMSVALLSTI